MACFSACRGAIKSADASPNIQRNSSHDQQLYDEIESTPSIADIGIAMHRTYG
jgi:hypothetical protein